MKNVTAYGDSHSKGVGAGGSCGSGVLSDFGPVTYPTGVTEIGAVAYQGNDFINFTASGSNVATLLFGGCLPTNGSAYFTIKLFYKGAIPG